VVAFAAAPAVFHHLPVVAGKIDHLNDYVDLLTPFAVVGAATLLLLALAAPPDALALALVAAILYVDGHGIHLAANSVDNESPTGVAGSRAHFWDERFGHLEWHTGWFLLLAAVCLAERGRAVRLSRRAQAAVLVLLGVTFFTNTVEGGTWFVELAATAAFGAWALAARRPLVRLVAASFGIGAALIGIWAIWHGGVPQFSQVGWLWTPKPARPG
jgi:hypothetical protein